MNGHNVLVQYRRLALPYCAEKIIYEGHLESSEHGIITPQCVDKMLSNYTFLETRIHYLMV